MKTLRVSIFLISIAILLINCSSDLKEKAIADYVQTSGNTKTNLSMKVKSLNKVGVLTFKDSAKVLAKVLEEVTEKRIEENIQRIQDYDKEITKQIYVMIDATTKARSDHAQKTIKFYQVLISSDSVQIERYRSGDYENPELRDTELRDIHRRLKRFQASPDSILADKYNCTYKIKNPVLNDVEQEITRTFYLSPDGKKVFAVE